MSASLITVLSPGTVASAGETSRHAFWLPPAKLPNIMLVGVDGEHEDLRSLRGHPLFVNLWAEWCTPCRAEMPSFERFYQANRSTGFEIVGVDQGDSKEAVEAFLRKVPVTYRILMDPHFLVSNWYGFDRLPVTLVIDRAGAVVGSVVGTMQEQEMRAELQRALDASP
jgi:thiol-disulfide isomerase/thioredoxin